MRATLINNNFHCMRVNHNYLRIFLIMCHRMHLKYVWFMPSLFYGQDWIISVLAYTSTCLTSCWALTCTYDVHLNYKRNYNSQQICTFAFSVFCGFQKRLIYSRTQEFPGGIPGVTGADRELLDVSNRITTNSLKMADQLMMNGTVVSIENPASSMLHT